MKRKCCDKEHNYAIVDRVSFQTEIFWHSVSIGTYIAITVTSSGGLLMVNDDKDSY